MPITEQKSTQRQGLLIKEISLKHPRVLARAIHEFKILDAHKCKFETLQLQSYHQED